MAKAYLQACYIFAPTVGRLGEMAGLETHVYSAMSTCSIYDSMDLLFKDTVVTFYGKLNHDFVMRQN